METPVKIRRRWIAQVAAGAILGCAILPAQTTQANPQFEVASVKRTTKPDPSDERRRELMRSLIDPGRIPMEDPGRIRLEDWALVDLIAAAYRVRATQVVGPAWISEQGFDVEAKIPEGTPNEQLNAMLQALLEERFGLKVHRSSQTKQGYALVIGKGGPNLKPAEAEPTSEQREQQSAAQMERLEKLHQQGTISGFRRLTQRSMTTEQLATHLARLAEAPVVDQTGLTGKYSVVIETWNSTDVPGGTVFEAVEKLGLKLESRKLTIETVMVDEVSKTPTAN
jgi:uncharacterized protein (TIGR03435 family)